LEHLTREKIVNRAVNSVKNLAKAILDSIRVTITTWVATFTPQKVPDHPIQTGGLIPG
jgi:hypothetical protein